MRRLVAPILALTACDGGRGDDYMIVPGGDDTPIHPAVDGALPDDAPPGDAPATIVGRVCLVDDLRALTSCATSGAGGLLVSLGNAVATTNVDGAFTLFAPTETSLIWRVTGPDLMTSVMPRGADAQIPAITATRYAELATSNGVILLEQEGAVVLQVLQQGAPLAGVTVAATPTPAYAPFYDGVSPDLWEQGATGPAGVSWLAGVGLGTVGVAVTPPQRAASFIELPVEDTAITFATLELP